MNSKDDVRRFVADALEESRDGQLEPAKLAALRELLLTSAEARRYYLEFNEFNHWLLAHNASPADAVPSRVGRPVLMRSMPWIATVAVAVTILLAVWVTYTKRNGMPNSESPPRAIASLEQLQGVVQVTSAAAETAELTAPRNIQSGDTIRTQGALSSAVLTYRDGSRISPVGQASMTASDKGHKNIVFHSGAMFASVVTQPNKNPFLVVTPQDRVEVYGGRFSLDVTSAETKLCVREGSVRLTRLQDGKSVDVAAGQRVVSHADSQLISEPIPQTPDHWSEDFEGGLPPQWEIGKFVTKNLPADARGGVQAVRGDGEADCTFAIATDAKWTQGLFAAHEDTHLHVTFSMQDPGWFNMLILTRTADGDPPQFAGNYIFDQPVWDGEPGEWATMTIPLSQFRPLPPSREKFKNAIPFQLLFSSPDKDRGLVIDRIWVTRGGPDKVEVQKVEAPQ